MSTSCMRQAAKAQTGSGSIGKVLLEEVAASAVPSEHPRLLIHGSCTSEDAGTEKRALTNVPPRTCRCGRGDRPQRIDPPVKVVVGC